MIRRFFQPAALALLLAALLALLLPWGQPRAQGAPKLGLGDVLYDVSRPGAQDLPLALPLPIGGSPEAQTVWEVVKHDLEMSGYFKIIDPAAYLEPAGTGVEPGQFRYEDWDVPGAVVLAKTKVTASGSGQKAEIWVYDVPGRRKMGAKAFTVTSNQPRRLGHRIADEIIYLLTGELGIFSTRLAVVSSGSGNKEIGLVDVDGYGFSSLTKNGSINLQPAWSSDGGRIAYTSYIAGNPDVYVLNLGSGKVQRISNRVGVNIGAAFSPGGDLLALTLTAGGRGDSDIFTINASTGEKVAQLSPAPGIDVSPTWSPDGGQIAFSSERSGGLQVYVMSSKGGDARRVTFQGSHNTDPAWSPKGDRLAFVGRDGNFDVFTCGTDGKNVLRITQGQGDNEDPTWSPDGRYLAFGSTRSGGSHIYMSTADGRVQSQMTRGGGGYTNPAWSPRISW